MANVDTTQSGYSRIGTDGVGILSAEALDRILDSSELRLPSDRRSNAMALVRRVVPDLIRHSMGRRLDAKEVNEFRKLIASLKRYAELGREVHIRVFSPPPLPNPEFLLQASKWISEVEAASGNGRPPKFWNRSYLPVALGLFAAIFEREPTSTAGVRSEAKGDEISGPAARFVESIRAEVRKMIVSQQIGLSGNEKKLVAISWPERTPDNLERAIADCLREQGPAFDDHVPQFIDGRPVFINKTYRWYRDAFRDQLAGKGPRPLGRVDPQDS